MKEIPKGKLVDDGDSGDNKRHFIVHNNADFRIEIDTDDCDRQEALRMSKELIRRWNSFEK